MLTLSSVSKHFGGLQVLQRIDLEIAARGIYGLIGPNGAGKTTVFNLITGLLPPSEGTIEFLGQRLNGLPPHRIARAGIARTFQNIRLFKEMSLVENVLLALAEQHGASALRLLVPGRAFQTIERRERELALELLERMGLGNKANQFAGQLSYGEQRRLEIARALATRPKLLLLDEPAAGMNSAEKQQLMDDVIKLGNSGLSVLVIEHDMRFIMGLCERITVLNFGEVIAEGTPGEIRSNRVVVEAYLGNDDHAVPLQGAR
ncbi:MAG: ABC transporter ATP-binding protein [Deltaproteobacteria bacterium]|nr:ABC transporter ATP-binding protein [Deltaproteobacteria bacterium]